VLLACRAVVDETPGARALFEDALASVDGDVSPFEVARVRLAYGEWLRRGMHALEARGQFRLAARAFEVLGAGDWQGRAERELRAAGAARPLPTALEAVDLSEQERRVASLAAAGLTNKQIAGQLYLSPRTVSGHLYRLFPKLGVTTRAGLRDALLRRAGDGAGADAGDART
jgi:DNA-binding CsgD family transcriptional regulator